MSSMRRSEKARDASTPTSVESGGITFVTTAAVQSVDAQQAAQIVHHEIPLNALIQDICEDSQAAETERALIQQDLKYIKEKLDKIEGQNTEILRRLK